MSSPVNPQSQFLRTHTHAHTCTNTHIKPKGGCMHVCVECDEGLKGRQNRNICCSPDSLFHNHLVCNFHLLLNQAHTESSSHLWSDVHATRFVFVGVHSNTTYLKIIFFSVYSPSLSGSKCNHCTANVITQRGKTPCGVSYTPDQVKAKTHQFALSSWKRQLRMNMLNSFPDVWEYIQSLMIFIAPSFCSSDFTRIWTCDIQILILKIS